MAHCTSHAENALHGALHSDTVRAMSKGSPNLVVRLPGDMRDRLAAAADRRGMTVSELVRDVIERSVSASDLANVEKDIARMEQRIGDGE